MGKISWMYSDTNNQVLDYVEADTYLLVPKPFQNEYGEAIYESCYRGYGDFDEHDVFDLIPEWNKEIIPEIIQKMKSGNWHCPVGTEDLANFQAYYEDRKISCSLRHLGILMAWYDEDNLRLKYPIKITTKEMDYDEVVASVKDPDQGWCW